MKIPAKIQALFLKEPEKVRALQESIFNGLNALTKKIEETTIATFADLARIEREDLPELREKAKKLSSSELSNALRDYLEAVSRSFTKRHRELFTSALENARNVEILRK